MFKILLLAAIFSFLSFHTIPSFCDDGSSTDEEELESVASDIIYAILGKNFDDLMELTQLEGAFQSDKKYYVRRLQRDYFNTSVITSDIEISRMRITNDDEATVMVITHLTTVDNQGGLSEAPRNEVWKFIKGKKRPVRGKWLLLLEK